MGNFDIPGSDLDGKKRSEGQQKIYDRVIKQGKSTTVYGEVGSGKTVSIEDMLRSLFDQESNITLVYPPRLGSFYTDLLESMGLYNSDPRKSDTYIVGNRNYPAKTERAKTYPIIATTPLSSVRVWKDRWVIIDEYGSAGTDGSYPKSIKEMGAEGYVFYLDSSSAYGLEEEEKADVHLQPRDDLFTPIPTFGVAEPYMTTSAKYKKKYDFDDHVLKILDQFEDYQHLLIACQNNKERASLFKRLKRSSDFAGRQLFNATGAKLLEKKYNAAINSRVPKDTAMVLSYGSKIQGLNYQHIDALIIIAGNNPPVASSFLQLLGRVVRPSKVEGYEPFIYFIPGTDYNYYMSKSLIFLDEIKATRAAVKDNDICRNLITNYPEVAFMGLHSIQGINRARTPLSDENIVMLMG